MNRAQEGSELFAGTRIVGWLRIELTEDERRAVQRPGSLERGDLRVGGGHEHHGGQHRHDVRTPARDRGAKQLQGPIALVLDNARYQRNAVGV